MKLLLGSVVWCPEDHPRRHETLKRHLDKLATYQGEYDICVVDNGSGPQVLKILQDFEQQCKDLNRNLEMRYNKENKGWAHGRNTSIKKCMDGGYDLVAMLDCDIYIETEDWIRQIQRAACVIPAFMGRVNEIDVDPRTFCSPGKTLDVDPKKRAFICLERFGGITWHRYDEYLGCLNVMTREAIEKVGGYDCESIPSDWGFQDPFWGRCAVKAGLFKSLSPYPALPLKIIEEHDDDYDKLMDPKKYQWIRQYNVNFLKAELEIRTGARSCFFDYNIGQ